jgi:hypothetical protein
MIIEIIVGSIIVGAGIGFKIFKKYTANNNSPSPPQPSLPPPLPFEIKFFDNQFHTNLLLSIPIKIDSKDIDNFELNIINLCKNPTFINYMNEEGVNFLELYDCKTKSGIIEYRLNQSVPFNYS